jgi:3-mercaptopyruvate sulfurtransferase SseA
MHWPDWLGYERKPEMLPFEEARVFVHTLGFKKPKEWTAYCQSGKKPANIPSNPNRFYAGKGWIDWSDWLGDKPKLSFEEARAFVRTLGLKSGKEWRAYCRSGKKPTNIPRAPHYAYADNWVHWPDWLGYKPKPKALPFKKARAFVRTLGFKGQEEWKAYCQSGKKPANIPAAPHLVYAGRGWMHWPDWLGYERKPEMLPFKKARAFARRRGFKKVREWEAYCRSGKKPTNVPTKPSVTYAGKGWVNWPDWLGHGTPRRSRTAVRGFKTAGSDSRVTSEIRG